MRATVLVFILNLVALIIFGPVFADRISTGLFVFIPVAAYHALVFGVSWYICKHELSRIAYLIAIRRAADLLDPTRCDQLNAEAPRQPVHEY